MEYLLLLLILGISFLPAIKNSQRQRKSLVILALLVSSLTFILACYLGNWNTKNTALRTAFAEQVPIIHQEDGYIGSESCQSCHPKEHASWHKTYHRTMTQEASLETVKGDFSQREHKFHGRRYLLERRGDEFWAELVDPDWEWDHTKRIRTLDLAQISGAPRVWKQIVMVTGSHDTQIYWVRQQEPKKPTQLLSSGMEDPNGRVDPGARCLSTLTGDTGVYGAMEL